MKLGKSAWYHNVFIIAVFISMTLNAFAQQQWVLDGDWHFFQGNHKYVARPDMDYSNWPIVTVPHTWNTDVVNGTGNYKGPGSYRKKFQIPAEMIGKRIFLRFEGALTLATVYVNGKEIGNHAGGYSAFAFEITKHVKFGDDNLLSVLVDNSDNLDYVPTSDYLFTRFGGIYRPVWILVKEPVCITPLDYASPGVYLKQTSVTDKQAQVEILTKISNGSEDAQHITLETSITDADGKTVWTNTCKVTIENDSTKAVTQKTNIENPHLWNGKKDPYLYKATVKLLKQGEVIDSTEQPLGLRYFSVDKDKGFSLNGNDLPYYGVCRHQEWDDLGSALTDENHRRDIELILDLGANGIRLAHYQQAEMMYKLADQTGLVVWAEVPITPPYQKENHRYMLNAKQQITEMIRQNYNHPSIIFWGIYNEVDIPLEHVQQYNTLMKTEDPIRLTTAASNRDLEQRHRVTDVIAWNRYDGWYGGEPGAIGQWADKVRQADLDLSFGVSEYGAGGCISQQKQNPTAPDPSMGQFFPEQYQCLFHEKTWAEIDKRPYLWCKLIWNMFDFSWPVVDRGDRDLINHKGLMTYDRKHKKDAFYFYKANWSDEPVLYITSKRHTERISAETEIKIYSNCQQVEAKLNGRSLGIKSNPENAIYRWENITLKEGGNTIEVTGSKSSKQYKDSCSWYLSGQ